MPNHNRKRDPKPQEITECQATAENETQNHNRKRDGKKQKKIGFQNTIINGSRDAIPQQKTGYHEKK